MKIISRSLSCMYVERRKACVLVIPVAVREQYNAPVITGKQLPVQKDTRTVGITNKHVHLGTYLTVINTRSAKAVNLTAAAI